MRAGRLGLALALAAVAGGCAQPAGPEAWITSYDGSAHLVDGGLAIAVDPGGRRVYAAGTSEDSPGVSDWVITAVDADSGERLWATRYEGSVAGVEEALAIAAAPDGTWVAAAGTSGGRAAVAVYDALTGHERWQVRHAGTEGGGDAFRGIGISPNGSHVIAA